MRSLCFVGLLLIAVLPAVTFGQLDTVWLRQFDGGNGGEEIFSDMVVDRAGNVYLAGCAVITPPEADIIVRKYSATGDMLWMASYDGRAHGDDSAAALVVDSLGQVYVCGWSMDTLFDIDMVTLKLSADGQLLWAKTWRRAFNQDDAANAICLDRLGRVIVTGYSSDSTGNIDYCTICYNGTTGDTAWVRYYNRTPENDEDISYAVCVDDSNNVYVTGTSYDDGTDYDIATVRYNPNGTRTWLRRFNNWPWAGDDYGTKVVFDPTTRTIVIAGIVYDDNQDYNYFTMKYRRNGDSLWARTYNRYPANNEDLLYALAVDLNGNVFVTGTSLDDVTDYDIATVSYTPAGIPRWTQRYDAFGLEEEGNDITLDSLGQVLVVGSVDTRTSIRDVAVLKYRNTGERLYTYLWDNPYSNGEDLGYRMFTRGGDRNIYIGGISYVESTNYDLVVLRFYEILHDFGLGALITPDSLWITDTMVPIAVVGNYSINNDSGWVKLAVEPGNYRDSVWLTLFPGAVDTVNFAGFQADSAGLFRVTCWCELVEDERRWNDTLWTEVVVWDESSGVAEDFEPGPILLSVTPNPLVSTGVIRFTLGSGGGAGIKIYDRAGMLVQRFFIPVIASRQQQVVLRLDAQNWPAGVYFLSLEQKMGSRIEKIVIQR